MASGRGDVGDTCAWPAFVWRLFEGAVAPMASQRVAVTGGRVGVGRFGTPLGTTTWRLGPGWIRLLGVDGSAILGWKRCLQDSHCLT